jgi:hypothetical protein
VEETEYIGVDKDIQQKKPLEVEGRRSRYFN